MSKQTRKAYEALIIYILDQYYEEVVSYLFGGCHELFDNLPSHRRLEELLEYMLPWHSRFIQYCYSIDELQGFIDYCTH